MSKASPSERGYHPVMLTQQAFEALLLYKGRNGLSSLTSAVSRALDEAQKPTPQAVDVESLIMACRATGSVAQRIRDWFGV